MSYKAGILLLLLWGIVGLLSLRSLPLDEWREILEVHESECLCETNAINHHLENFYSHGEISDHACFKCLVRCNAFKLNILTPDGNVNTEKWQELPGVTEEIAIKCSGFNNTDLCQKAYNMLKCAIGEMLRP